MSLCEKLVEALRDEKKAGPDYKSLAEQAEKEGQRDLAETLRSIASDEEDHRTLIEDYVKELKCPIKKEG